MGFKNNGPGCCGCSNCLPCNLEDGAPLQVALTYFPPGSPSVTATIPLAFDGSTDTALYLAGESAIPRARGGRLWRSGCFFLYDEDGFPTFGEGVCGPYLPNTRKFTDFRVEFFCDADVGSAAFLIYQMANPESPDDCSVPSPACVYYPDYLTEASASGFTVFGPLGYFGRGGGTGVPFGWHRGAPLTPYPRFRLDTPAADCDPLYIPFLGDDGSPGGFNAFDHVVFSEA